MKTSILATSTALLVTGAAAYATQDDPSTQPLDCAGQVVTTEPREPQVPAYDTPAAAAHAWAGTDDVRLDLSSDGSVARLLRADGSVRAQLHLASTRVDLGAGDLTAWSVGSSTSCVASTSSTWAGPDLLDCPASQVVRAEVIAGPAPAGAQTLEPMPLVVDPRDTGTVTRTDSGGSVSDEAAATTSRAGRVHTAVRLRRVDDRWQVSRIAECDEHAVGFAGGDTLEVVALVAGHCHLAPLHHQGQSWEALPVDDFGWGGARPKNWHGFGTVRRAGQRLIYRDLGGADLTFRPSGASGRAGQEPCA